MKSLTMHKQNLKTKLLENAVSIILVAFVVFMIFAKRSFSTWDNICNIINECSVYGITACAMTVAIICGEFDLSCASVFGGATVLFCLCCNSIGLIPGLIVTLLAGALIGALNGVLVAKVRMPAFVATLATMLSIKGLAYVVTDAQPVNTDNAALYAISKFQIGGITIAPIVFILTLLLFIWIMKYTKFGRDIYATGGNYEVARLSGINVEFCKFIIFVILGVCAALSGVMYCSRIMAGWAPYGNDLALWCVAATVIGGTSLMGGSGGIQKTIIGVLLMAILFNALTLLGVSGSMQKFVRGLVLIVVIMLDAIAHQKQKA